MYGERLAELIAAEPDTTPTALGRINPPSVIPPPDRTSLGVDHNRRRAKARGRGSMKVGVLCEYSGVVRDAFLRRGHDAVSCDLLPTEAEGPHIQGDCLAQDWSGFDLLVCHPPCTHLAVSGARHFSAKRANGSQRGAINFFLAMTTLPTPMIAIENPVGIMSSEFRKPDQIIQPYQFGDEAQKTTCLWLKGLPRLSVDDPLFRDSTVVGKGEFVTWSSGKVHARWYTNASAHVRSRTFQGIADAMAEQWGSLKP